MDMSVARSGVSQEVGNVWDVFSKHADVKKGQCKVCQKMINNKGENTSAMRAHALSLHQITIKVRDSKKNSSVQEDEKCGTIMTEFQLMRVEMPLRVTLARMISLFGMSFNIFEQWDDLRETILTWIEKKGIQEELPATNKTIRNHVMKVESRSKKILINVLKKFVTSGERFSVDIDEWSSFTARRFMNVSLFKDSTGYWNLGLDRIRGSASADALLKLLKMRLGEFKVDFQQIVCLITDGPKVMRKIAKKSGIEHQFCFSHGIQLAVTDVLYKKLKRKVPRIDSSDEEDDEKGPLEIEVEEPLPTSVVVLSRSISISIDKVRKLGKFFKKSGPNNDILQGYIRDKFGMEKQLKVDCKTRWSSLYMIKRFWEVKDCVDHTLLEIRKNSQDRFIYWNILATLRPVMFTINDLSLRDSSLLTARTTLLLLFKKLETQDNPLAKEFLVRLRVCMMERKSINFSVLKYLQDGQYTNDFPFGSYEDVEKCEDEYEPSMQPIKQYIYS